MLVRGNAVILAMPAIAAFIKHFGRPFTVFGRVFQSFAAHAIEYECMASWRIRFGVGDITRRAKMSAHKAKPARFYYFIKLNFVHTAS